MKINAKVSLAESFPHCSGVACCQVEILERILCFGHIITSSERQVAHQARRCDLACLSAVCCMFYTRAPVFALVAVAGEHSHLRAHEP